MHKYLCLFFFLWQLGSTLGQDKYTMIFHPDMSGLHNKISISDTLVIESQVQNYIKELNFRGYFFATTDSVIHSTGVINVYINNGELVRWLGLRSGNVPSALLTKSGYKERFYRNRPFNYKQLLSVKRNLIRSSENGGYPFARVFLDSIDFKNNQVTAALNYSQGPYLTFDTIVIHGDSKIKKRFLQRNFGIIPGQAFNQSKIDFLHRRISKMPYLEKERESLLLFGEESASLVLFLSDKRVNYFDGIVGFLPNEGQDKKMLITGQVNLVLQNLFGTGKKIDAAWQRFDNESQILDLAYFHPALFSSYLNGDVFLKLFKQDTTFINIDRGIGLSQNTDKNAQLGIFANIKSSRSLAANSIVKQDFNVYQYGLKLSLENLDNIFFPKKGWELLTTISFGNKSLKNLIVSNSNDDSKPIEKSLQSEAFLSLNKFTKLNSFTTLLVATRVAGLWNNRNQYFISDFYRIGGLKSLRGFNENNYYVRNYFVGTLETRVFIEEDAYLLAFIDQGVIYNPLLEQKPIDYPTGLGLGLSFSSGPGVFTFIYSLGRNNQETFRFNLSKIHFGFVSKF
jgi:translocation and assembly module TamA